MRVGFIGLGTLGREIVKRLVSQGIEVIVWNRTREKAIELGLSYVETPSELIKQVDKVFVMVFDSQASEEVIFGKDGLVRGGVSGKTIVDMTTNHYRYAEKAYEEIKGLGGYYLDAPVLGSVIPARKGELTILVGGDKDKFEESKPLFEKFAKTIFYVGKSGNASKLKLINNVVLGGFMQVLAEALALGEKAGFEKKLILDILESGAGKSMILDVKREKLLKEDFDTHFSIDLIHKDLHYAEDLIFELKTFSVSTQNIKSAYAIARSMGLGHMDFSAVYKIFKLNAGD